MGVDTSEMRAERREPDQVSITDDATSARWVFLVLTDGEGRRHLGERQVVGDARCEPGLLRQACEVAKSEAMRARLVED